MNIVFIACLLAKVIIFVIKMEFQLSFCRNMLLLKIICIVEEMEKVMTKEYRWFIRRNFSDLAAIVDEYAADGWRLVNFIYDNRDYIAVVERNKFVKVEMKI